MAELGIFGHHPDQSIDLCCEVDMLEGWVCDILAGLRSQWPFWARLSRLLQNARFIEGLDEQAGNAVDIAKTLERRLLDGNQQPVRLDSLYA